MVGGMQKEWEHREAHREFPLYLKCFYFLRRRRKRCAEGRKKVGNKRRERGEEDGDEGEKLKQMWPNAKFVKIGWCKCVQFSSVTLSCPTLCDPMIHSTPGLPVHHQLLEFTKTMSIESVMPSNHLILCRPLLLLPSIFPSIRVFSNGSALHIRWPKYIARWKKSLCPQC